MIILVPRAHFDTLRQVALGGENILWCASVATDTTDAMQGISRSYLGAPYMMYLVRGIIVPLDIGNEGPRTWHPPKREFCIGLVSPENVWCVLSPVVLFILFVVSRFLVASFHRRRLCQICVQVSSSSIIVLNLFTALPKSMLQLSTGSLIDPSCFVNQLISMSS